MTKVEPLFVKEADVARMLCCDLKWLHSNAKMLEETTGFPKKDAVLGKRHKESIIEWARERSQRRMMLARGARPSSQYKENFDAF